MYVFVIMYALVGTVNRNAVFLVGTVNREAILLVGTVNMSKL